MNTYVSPMLTRYWSSSYDACAPVLKRTVTVQNFGWSLTAADAVTGGAVVVVRGTVVDVVVVVAEVGGAAIVSGGAVGGGTYTVIGVSVVEVDALDDVVGRAAATAGLRGLGFAPFAVPARPMNPDASSDAQTNANAIRPIDTITARALR